MDLLENLKDRAEEAAAELKEQAELAADKLEEAAEQLGDKLEEIAEQAEEKLKEAREHLKENLEEAGHIAEAFGGGAQEQAEPYLEEYIKSKQQSGTNDITK